MIEYETNRSPFFVANKEYCELIESKLKTLGIDCSGFCNSYGYEIQSLLKKNNVIYNLKFHKHQSTQNGVVIPVDAIDYAGLEIIVSGLNKKFEVGIGKSSFLRIFTSTKYKDKIQKPYFVKFNYESLVSLVDSLVKIILNNNISVFKLNRGIIVCKMHTNKVDPIMLIEEIINWV